MSLEFEYDAAKASANFDKHGVGFDEAATVFGDPLAAIHFDGAHSLSEDREIIIGHSHLNRLLLVAFTERYNRIRIISARLATKRERKDYEESSNQEET